MKQTEKKEEEETIWRRKILQWKRKLWVIFCRTPWQLGSNTAYDPEGLVFDTRNRISQYLFREGSGIIPWISQLRVNGMPKRKEKKIPHRGERQKITKKKTKFVRTFWMPNTTTRWNRRQMMKTISPVKIPQIWR